MSDRKPNHKPRVLTILRKLIPSSIIGIIKPMLALQEEGKILFRMKYTYYYSEKDIINSDIVILCRSIMPEELNIISACRKYNKTIIYDIDDNFFSLSLETALGYYHRNPVCLYVVTEMIRCADIVRIYSRPMESIARKFNGNVYRVKSYFDFNLIKGLKRKPHDKIRIVYATSRRGSDFLVKVYLPAIRRILEDYGERVEFYIFGSVPDQLAGFKNVKSLPYQPNYSKYIRNCYLMGFDIGLAPLTDDVFHNSKTNNKFREYGGMGICGVYSNTLLYRDCIKDGVNGLLAEDSVESWYNSVARLINDGTLRETISKNAENTVREDYSFESNVKEWEHILKAKPQNEPVAYSNILNLNVLAIRAKERDLILEARMSPLMNLAGFLKNNIVIKSFWAVSHNDVETADVIVYFTSSTDNIEQAVFTWGNTGKLVIDTGRVYTGAGYPGVLFTNAEEGGEIESFKIGISPHLYGSLNGIKLAQAKTAFGGNMIDDLYTFEYNTEKYINEYFSTDSSVFAWAELLRNYARKPHVKISRSLLWMVKTSFKYAANKANKLFLNRIYRIFSSATNRMKSIRSLVADYIRVNIIKRY